jgi:hypothetical protein
MRFLRYVGYILHGDKERSDGIRSQLGIGKLDKQIEERKKNGWNSCRGYHREGRPSKFYIINRWENVIMDDQEEDD